MSVDSLLNKLKTYQSLLFDLDNTLFSQQEFDRGAFEEIAHEFKKNGQLNDRDFTHFLITEKQKRGSCYPHLFDDAIGHFGLKPRLLSQMIKIYKSHNGIYLCKDNSLQSHLKELKHSGKQLFVVSNGYLDTQRQKLIKLGILPLLDDYIICSGSAPQQLKPAPWAFLQLQKKHKLIYPVMVGDNLKIDGGFAEQSHIPFIHFKYS